MSDVSLSFDANPGLTYPQHRRGQHPADQAPQFHQPPSFQQQYPAYPQQGPSQGGPPGSSGMAFMTFDMAKPGGFVVVRGGFGI